MSATDDLYTLLERLHTDAALIASYRANPRAAMQGFALTAHEYDAVVTRDLDDFVALAVVGSISELPAVMRGVRGPGIPGRLLALLLALPRRLGLARPPEPDPIPRPRPLPGEGPGPRPRPAPGPDPPPGPGPGPDPGPDN